MTIYKGSHFKNHKNKLTKIMAIVSESRKCYRKKQDFKDNKEAYQGMNLKDHPQKLKQEQEQEHQLGHQDLQNHKGREFRSQSSPKIVKKLYML